MAHPITTDPHFTIAKLALAHLKGKIGTDDLLALLRESLQDQSTYTIPVQAYAEGLSILQTTCKYLHDVYTLSSRQIGSLIQRDTPSISASINKATKQHPQPFSKQDATITIPTHAFKQELGPLECVSYFLKKEYHLTYSQIGKLLKRDQRNIWQSVNGAKRKLGDQ